MTFSADIPRNLESPGVFPIQCRTNWVRLKTIINADHVFNDTGQADDGIHRQMTTVNRGPSSLPPVLPTGSNGMLYSYLDSVTNQTQLAFYNNVETFQLTPTNELFPYVIRGSATLAPGASTGIGIYPDPGFVYAGTGYAMVLGLPLGFSKFSYYGLFTPDLVTGTSILIFNSGANAPQLFYQGNKNLGLRNNDSVVRTINFVLNLAKVL